MAINEHQTLPAPLGMDAATDAAHLPPTLCQYLQNVVMDRPGQLRAQFQMVQMLTTEQEIQGLDWFYGQRNTYDRLLLIEGYILRESAFQIPGADTALYFGSLSGFVPAPFDVEYPPTLQPASEVPESGGGLNPGWPNAHYRMAQFLDEMVIVGDPVSVVYYHPTLVDSMPYGIGSTFSPRCGDVMDGYIVTATAKSGNDPDGVAGRKTIGTVTYRLTAGDYLGRESEPGSSTTVTLDATYRWAQLQVLMPQANSQTTYWNLYVNVVGGDVWYRVKQWTVTPDIAGTIQVFSENLTDALIQAGSTMSPVGTNDCPNPASIVAVHRNRVLLNDITDASALQVSNQGSCTQFATIPDWDARPTDGGRFELDSDQGNAITAIVGMGSMSIVLRRRSIWVFQGDDGRDFIVRELSRERGCIAPDTACRCENAVLFLSDDGVYALDGLGTAKKISKQIEPILLDNESGSWRETLEQACAVFMPKRNEYHLFLDTRCFVYALDSGQWHILADGVAPFGLNLTWGLETFSKVG